MLATTSSAWTLSPTLTSHLAKTPCVIDSPIIGTGITTLSVFAAVATTAGAAAAGVGAAALTAVTEPTASVSIVYK